MTLIIALLCKDAIIIGADSKATEEVTGHVVFDPSFTVDKVFGLGDKILWGGSGQGGFVQRMKERLDSNYASHAGNFAKAASDTCGHIRGLVVAAGKLELQSMVSPDEGRLRLNKFLFCGFSGDGPWIYEVLGNGQATRYEKPFGFHAIGSAAHFAYAAFGLLRHHGVNAHGERGGLVVAHRILGSSVSLAAGGVGEPLQYWVLTKSGIKQIPENSPEFRNMKETVGLWAEKEKAALGEALGGTA